MKGSFISFQVEIKIFYLWVFGLELLDFQEMELADELAIGTNEDEIVLCDLGHCLFKFIFLN